jgi:hypothetical protein
MEHPRDSRIRVDSAAAGRPGSLTRGEVSRGHPPEQVDRSLDHHRPGERRRPPLPALGALARPRRHSSAGAAERKSSPEHETASLHSDELRIPGSIARDDRPSPAAPRGGVGSPRSPATAREDRGPSCTRPRARAGAEASPPAPLRLLHQTPQSSSRAAPATGREIRELAFIPPPAG